MVGQDGSRFMVAVGGDKGLISWGVMWEGGESAWGGGDGWDGEWWITGSNAIVVSIKDLHSNSE